MEAAAQGRLPLLFSMMQLSSRSVKSKSKAFQSILYSVTLITDHNLITLAL